MKISTLALLSAAVAALTVLPALADTATYSLTTVDPTVAPGNSVTFNGTITAPVSNAGVIYLLGDSYSLSSPLSLTDAGFQNTPVFLSAGQSYVGPLFTVTLPGATSAGTYDGTFTVEFEDANFNAFNESADFEVTAAAASSVTPEPGSWLLLSTGLAGVGLVCRRFRARIS